MPEPDVEIYYALHGGEPILIGSGSIADLARIDDEARELNAKFDPESRAFISPGTEHFYRSLGEIAGVVPVTDAVLEHYSGLVEGSRKAFRQKLKDGSVDQPD